MAAALIDTLVAPISGTPGGSFRLQVYPAEMAWAFELDIAQALQRGTGRPMARTGEAAIAVDAAIVRGVVEYTGVRRDGLFGAKIADRTVYLEMRLKTWDPSTGATVFSGEFSDIARDTIRLAEIDDLATPGLEMTKGAPPAEGVFTSVLEPLILIGALAVGVFLLFTMRS
jgi:hypothetical protein